MKGIRSILVILLVSFTMLQPTENLLRNDPTNLFHPAKVKAASTKRSDQNYDVFFLKQDANFKKSIGNGVYLVPVNVLGRPEFTNEDILDMIKEKDPEQISKKISTLYDAVRYYYISGFQMLRGDHKDLPYDGVIWQHHKTGEEAVLTNEGDCSGNAVLISYLLEGDYDEVGYFSYNLKDGGGHVFNYFKQDGKYFFLDFSSIRDAMMEDTQINWRGAYYPTNLVMADSIEKFVQFYKSNYLNNMKAIFNTYKADKVAPIGYKSGKYYLPNDLKDLKFYGDVKQISFVLTKAPKDIPCWNSDGLLDRDMKAEVAIVPYSYQDYEGRGTHYDLRIFTLNEINVELTRLTLSYYDAGNRLITKNEYDKEDLCRFQPNNFIFDWKPLPMQNGNNYASVKGTAVFEDIHGNVITEKFEHKMK